MLDEGRHAAAVDDWLERTADGLPPELLFVLFERGFSAIWRRLSTTLGEVTLAAIADRVLYNAAERFPLVRGLTVDTDGNVRYRDVSPLLGASQRSDLLAAFRFVLVEFLSVIGNLTAEILSEALHAELWNVSRPESLEALEGARQSS